MRFGCTTLCSALLLTCTVSAFASTHARRGPTSQHMLARRSASRSVAKPVSQRAIDPERTTQIQAALVKQGYLTGEPTGKWDNGTQAALQKMQADNGWQTKLVPDSRAIIKLGLGPGSTPVAPETASSPASSMMSGSQSASESDTTFPAQR